MVVLAEAGIEVSFEGEVDGLQLIICSSDSDEVVSSWMLRWYKGVLRMVAWTCRWRYKGSSPILGAKTLYAS